MHKVSVIVPVYKAESYLHKCIDSILQQSFRDFELILVDDGSPDASGRICDEYAKIDQRVSVVHKSNGGVSSARQKGLNMAKGDYVIFVDSDDWVEPDYLSELYNKALRESADMVICDFYEIERGVKNRVDCSFEFVSSDELVKSLFCGFRCFCMNKLVRRSAFTDNSIEFPLDISIGEDMYVMVSLFKAGIIPVYLNRALYNYTIDVNANSLSRNFSLNHYRDTLRMLDLFRKLMKGHIHYNVCEDYIIHRLVSRCFYGQLFSSKEFKNEMSKYKKNILRNSNIATLKKIMYYMACIGFYRPMYIIAKWKQGILR